MKDIIKEKIKRIVNSLGYDIRRYRDGNIPKKTDEDYLLKSIFHYFPEWVSRFEIDGSRCGGNNDYTTERISMLNVPQLYKAIDFLGKSVLELGALEGGNTIILEKLGIKRITSIEGRIESYIKCCVIKNLFQLNKTTFILDDIRNLTAEKYGSFDIVFVAGILYHLDSPHLLLHTLGEMTNTLVISTHYADGTSPTPLAEELILKGTLGSYKGKAFTEAPLDNPNAGLQSKSFWPYEDDLLKMISDSGFINISVIKKNPIPTENYKIIYLVAKK